MTDRRSGMRGSGAVAAAVAAALTVSAAVTPAWFTLTLGGLIAACGIVAALRAPAAAAADRARAELERPCGDSYTRALTLPDEPPIEFALAHVPPPAPVAAPPPAPVPPPDDRRARAVAADLASYPKLTEVVRTQLAAVNEETGSAALTLIERLTSIDGRVDAILATIRESVSLSESLVRLSKDEAFSRLTHLDSAAARDLEHGRAQVKGGLADTQRLFAFIGEIRDVAEQTNILALNASVEAARAGDAGRAFAVVAREVRKLSTRSSELAQRIEDDVHRTFSAIEARFNEMLATTQAGQENAQRMLSAELGSLSERLSHLMETQDRTIGHVADQGREIADLVMALLANLQFQDVTRQQVEQVTRTLHELDDHTVRLRTFLTGTDPLEEAPDVAALLDRLYGTYVMHRQRAVHAAVVGGAPFHPAHAADEPLIELF